MDGLLNPVSQTYKTAADEHLLVQEVQPAGVKTSSRAAFKAVSVDEAIETLRNEPDYDTLISVLQFLLRGGSKTEDFRIGRPGPQTAKIAQVLVAEIVPNYWALLKETATEVGAGEKATNSDLDLLLVALRSVTGLKAILNRLRALILEKKAETRDVKRSDIELNLSISLELLCSVLDGGDRVAQLWTSMTAGIEDISKRRPLAFEILNVLGGGRVVSLAAEAASLLSQDLQEKTVWIAGGVEYSQWLTWNIITFARQASTPEDLKLVADLLAKALRLGYSDAIVKILLAELISASDDGQSFRSMFGGLAHLEQRKVLFAMLKQITETHLDSLDYADVSAGKGIVSASAGVINRLIADDATLRSHLITWLTSSTGAGLGDGVGIRRAVMAVLSQDKESITTVFVKSLNQFGDKLYIKHSPMLQQEVHAQVLLLNAGYLRRLAPVKLNMLLRSSAAMSFVSSRLTASQTQARYLGMIVGEALSQLVHEGDKRLDFKMKETKSEEALWYKSLVDVSDVVGPVDPLISDQKKEPRKRIPVAKQSLKPKSAAKPSAAVSKAKAIIEEVESSEDEDDDIIPLNKPDEDEEDSDDDPETIRRDKPKAPVYVRDLITYLRDTENYDRQKLALTTAPVLIRRKANFGTEVKEHAEELASLLVGLQDKFEIEEFYDLKLQGMIALVVAQPQKMGQWFAKTFFDGDYSISQRSAVLTVLGLSARELAGFDTSEYAAACSFPSKTLPERVEQLYIGEESAKKQLASSSALKALPPNALDSISKSLTSNFLAPLAADAADQATGPDALKLSTFTSRLQTKSSSTATRKSKAKPRVRAIPNTTAQLIATSFFFPLTARFQSAIHSSYGRARGIVFQPFLLSLYLKTLALLLHAAGPSTLSLPDMTTELWGLLLGSSVRAQASGGLGVTHAVLFTLLTLLDVNGDRMRDLCLSQGKEVVETQEWVAQVFETTRGEDGGEENEVKMLAAGVLIRIRDGMEKYRMLLMGDMI